MSDSSVTVNLLNVSFTKIVIIVNIITGMIINYSYNELYSMFVWLLHLFYIKIGRLIVIPNI